MPRGIPLALSGVEGSQERNGWGIPFGLSQIRRGGSGVEGGLKNGMGVGIPPPSSIPLSNPSFRPPRAGIHPRGGAAHRECAVSPPRQIEGSSGGGPVAPIPRVHPDKPSLALNHVIPRLREESGGGIPIASHKTCLFPSSHTSWPQSTGLFRLSLGCRAHHPAVMGWATIHRLTTV